MNTLVTGLFEAEHLAAQAVRKLVKSCVPMDFVRTTPSGTGKGRPSHRSNRGASRYSGVIKVAVKAREYVAQQLAIRILRDYGAHDIECVDVEPRARARVRVAVRNPHARVPA